MDGSTLPDNRRVWRRLGVALALSVALHAWIAFGLPVKPARHAGRPGRALEAHLVAAQEPAPAKPVVLSGGKESLPPPKDAPAPPVPEPAKPAPEPSPEALPQTESRVEPPPVDGPPGIEVPQVEDPEFYPARMLDRFPKPVADVELRYPDQAGSEDLSGTVTLLLLIDELGMVVKASVVEADPPGYFEEAAIEAFRSILFTPAERDGKVVKSRLVVQVSFDAKTDSMRK
jgi:periplasmic protein TonB